MTPTEQAADRVKALVEWMSGRTQRGDDDRSFTHHAADLTTLLSALTALQARAEDAERENERLSARNLEVSTLAHGWMVAHDNLAAGLPVTYPSPADVPASLFVCALMAAAAETTYRIGFRDAERVTDERHIDYLRGNTIAGIAAAMQAPDADLTARVETLQARVGELEGDALRYRYLKEHHTSNYGMTREQPAEWTLCWDWQQIRPGEEFLGLDALIDADIARLDDDDRALLTPPLEQE